MEAFDHDIETCRRIGIDTMASLPGGGVEVVVSTEPPLIDTPFSGHGFTCPHGVAFWIEPTSEQIAVWARAGGR